MNPCWICRGDDDPTFPAFVCEKHWGYWRKENDEQVALWKLEHRNDLREGYRDR